MPPHIKAALSVACLLTAAAGYVFMVYLGQRGPSYAVVFLGLFATGAMWIFPEVVKKNVSQARK
jgi:hypothetical protein